MLRKAATCQILSFCLLTGCLAFSQAVRATESKPQATTGSELKISYSLAHPSSLNEPGSRVDLWERIRAGLAMDDNNIGLVRVHEAWYADRPAYIARTVERSRLYLFHIVEEVEKRGMPMEIALLPMIESAYNPLAVSPQNASGIWQFIPSTGRVYGLRQNGWYDGRKDVLAATDAALDYLQQLHAMFGDWQLALAAYNCGEGCVGRAIARNKAKGLDTDYASLNLPTETKHYVPKLLAVRNIVRDPRQFGITLESIANEPYFMQVALNRPMEARHAAKLAEMDLEGFISLNPGYQRKVIHTDTPGVLLLPADKVETFHYNLQRLGERNQLQEYRAKRGEMASAIAAKFGVSLEWLKEHNPVKLWRGKVANAQTLVVPAANGKPSQAMSEPPRLDPAPPVRASEAKQRAKTAKQQARHRTHTVRKGDTLKRLAKRYKVKVSDLRQFNQATTEPLRPGTKLTIPTNS
ncbi:MAG: transglycosylase SLT domain-containing protein [Betaproteobacteria bacterium]|nr:transglycosylase SLT domain-containing protein [Betaproteobacteria bacterium]